MPRMNKCLAILCTGCAALALAGCLKVKQLVVVNSDGSGNIVVSTAFPPETVAMMSQFAGMQNLGGDQGGGKPAPSADLFYNEDELREAAAQFGEDVTLQKSEKIDKDGMRGAIAVYAFKDISKVKLNTRQNMDMNAAMGAAKTGAEAAAGDYIRFAFNKGDTSKLTVLMPEVKSGGAAASRISGGVGAKKPDAQLPPELAALGLGGLGGAGAGGAAMMQMFKGMEMSFAIQVKGEVLKSNASHRDGERKDRFILLDMNMDKLMTSPEFQKIANENVADQSEMMKKFYALPGAHLETNREVIIEFK
jgi:hypothetical protein